MKRTLFIFSITIAVLSGCMLREPEGPAEQIGKGIDQVTRGVQRYDRDAAIARPQPTRIPLPRDTAREDYSSYDSDSDTGGPTPESWETYEEWRKRRGL